ncbi:hypothetical protein BXOR1_15960 [Xanthomonas oryzae pv. oryzicola]|nr:hypothetical protein ACU15_06735 [Xanthomonas oryzae pv. oryzicola]KOR46255.1 hypothetical protein ADT27_11215 [Xanthomonas oryzae]OLK87210.1 hypothetical protein BXOR1_15960 [Xanthomonas oryzae pv. oryzicola]QEO96634.1 hypothetical protein XOCgx_1641 [Xanthomonas oryzae pv. oryzicola]
MQVSDDERAEHVRRVSMLGRSGHLLRSGVEVRIDQKMPREMRWPLRCVLGGMVSSCDDIYMTHVRHISVASVL